MTAEPRPFQTIPPQPTSWRMTRERAGIAQAELARRAGIPAPILSQIESGRMVPTADEARRILAVLDPILALSDAELVDAPAVVPV